MTKNEAGAILKMIKSFYPNEFAKIEPQSMALLTELWASVCEGYTGEQMSAALKQYMARDTSGFAPKPGQLINYIHAPEDDADLNESEAWSMVLRAASNGNYHAAEEFEKLPPLVQKAVGTAYVLHEMAAQEITSVDESHFKRAYRMELERERTRRRLPPSTRNILEQLGGDDPMALPVGE